MNIAANKQASLRAYLVLALLAGSFFCEALFANEEIIHIVKSGDTIYGLAREYGVKVEEILFLNGIDDARKVQSGQRIRIPATSAMVPPINPDPNAPSVVLHRVQKGETLYGIAHQYGLPLQEIRSINNFADNYVLKSGDVIKIPVTGQKVAQVTARQQPPPARTSAASNPPAASGNPPAAITPAAASPPRTTSTARTNTPQAPSVSPRSVNPSIVWPIHPTQAAYMTGKLSGVALVGQKGETVYCIYPGTVLSAGPYRGFGRVAIVKSVEGYLYVYGGCETLFVRAGDYVTTGMELGRLGIDSVSNQAALFFMVYLNNTPVDPALAPRG
ncbi:MAG: LysM peptidoglycan-binding domain-containing M23 family metallopeptidase [Spirochaetaceae bacterium]|jgi:LysM repeat protein|nr:LysM peptidoglycan-binding domain-containing M23 family metallopeptidase [Spirochaetaceae bacterium]